MRRCSGAQARRAWAPPGGHPGAESPFSGGGGRGRDQRVSGAAAAGAEPATSRSRTLERPAPARAMPSGAAGNGARRGVQRSGPRR